MKCDNRDAGTENIKKDARRGVKRRKKQILLDIQASGLGTFFLLNVSWRDRLQTFMQIRVLMDTIKETRSRPWFVPFVKSPSRITLWVTRERFTYFCILCAFCVYVALKCKVYSIRVSIRCFQEWFLDSFTSRLLSIYSQREIMLMLVLKLP